MGDVHFIAYDQATGEAVASIVGSPADVADFLAIWLHNAERGVTLAQRLGVDFQRWKRPHDDAGRHD